MKRKIFFVLTLSVAALVMSSCTIVRGSGKVVTARREVQGFDQVTLRGVGTLIINPGEEEALEIEAEENLLPYIETRVQGGTLTIGFENDRWDTAIQPTRPIRYFLTVTNLEALELSGAGNIEVGEIDTDRIRIRTSGAGDIEIEKLTADSLTMDLSGAGSCHIHNGEVSSQILSLSGTGEYQAPDLQSQYADINISGVGGAKVWAADSLKVEISGAGSVDYYGHPTLSQNINGLGRIQSLGLK